MVSVNSLGSVAQLIRINNQRSRRAIILMLVVTGMMSACVLRLGWLQLIEGQHHRQIAENNRIRQVPVPSDRGNILDRNGKLLAANRLARSVYLWPRDQSPEQWEKTAAQLSPLLKIPTEEILDKLEKFGYKSGKAVRISRDLTPAAFLALEEQIAELKIRGVEIRGESNRYYPNGNIAAHVLGYIGEATEKELKANPEYPLGMVVGKMGIERTANSKLAGVWGVRLIEVDAKGAEIRQLGERSTRAGEPLQLTLDLDLQKTAEKALRNRRGAVVVLDVKTGAVLAIASGPTFDPSIFTRQIPAAEWKRLHEGNDNPFLNRALQGYPPGSTFKIVTATAGMESGKFSPYSMLFSTPYITAGGINFYEHGEGFGLIDFPEAFAYSSNTFFYQVGLETGPDEMAKWGRKFGIGDKSNLELLGLDTGSPGSIPTPAEKLKLYDEPWYVGDTVTMAIGQGVVLLTPLEEAMMVSAIANGGKRVKPHLFASQTNKPETQPESSGIHPNTIATIREGLVATVKKGTAAGLNDGSIPLTAGKTGTAEVLGQKDNALFVGYGPVKDPQIAIAVVVENGGFGAVSAVPIAHEIYKTYFKHSPKQSLSPNLVPRSP